MPCEIVFACEPGAADVAGGAGLVAAPTSGLVVFGVFVLDPVFFVVEVSLQAAVQQKVGISTVNARS
jgi:hypothetical protein